MAAWTALLWIVDASGAHRMTQSDPVQCLHSFHHAYRENTTCWERYDSMWNRWPLTAARILADLNQVTSPQLPGGSIRV